MGKATAVTTASTEPLRRILRHARSGDGLSNVPTPALLQKAITQMTLVSESFRALVF